MWTCQCPKTKRGRNKSTKTNNYFKKVKGKGDQVSGLLYPKLSELLYKIRDSSNEKNLGAINL